MSLKKYIQFNDDFKSSINIEYDYSDTNKINRYILTSSNVAALKFFANNIRKSNNRANILIGAYGKGKSNLLLVLLNILTSYGKNANGNINSFISKIKEHDTELYATLKNYRETKKKMLPIVINSNYDNLQSSFLLAIKDAIDAFGFKNIKFNSYFDVAYKTIEKWGKGNKQASDLLKKCLDKYKIKLLELKNGLKEYDNNYYNIFVDIYNCVTNGEEFNPLVNTDVIKIYKEVLHYIKKENNDYIGIYIVFDEFSKFLEKSSNETIIRDLKFLQDLAELASRSTNEEQIHFTCVTHKPIIEYLNEFGEKRVNDFKTIEGRFYNCYLEQAEEEAYELVKNAFIFDDNRIKSKLINDKEILSIYNYCKKLPMFKNYDDFDNTIKQGSYPINPIVLYILIKINDYVGQNERSIFSFITSDEKNSFRDFINKNMDKEYKLYSLDILYDYYEKMLKNNRMINIKDIYDKSVSALLTVNALKDLSESKRIIANRIIKSLCLIYLSGELDYFTPCAENIRLSLNIVSKEEINKFNQSKKILIENGIIEEAALSENLQFTNKLTSLLKNKAKNIVKENRDFSLENYLNNSLDEKFELPRKFNDENCITRFFRYIYLDKDTILNINSFDIYFDKEFQDGLIVNVVLLNENDEKIVLDKIKKIKDKRILFVLPNKCIKQEVINLCIMEETYEQMLAKEKISENERSIIESERDNLKELIGREISDYYGDNNSLYYKGKFNEINLNSLASEACNEMYSKTPILNYELINKNQPSVTANKSIEEVCSFIINNGLSYDNIKEFSNTSFENSIYKAFKYSVEINDIDNNEQANDLISKFFKSCEKEKKNIKELLNNLKEQGIYIRNGALPLYISRVLCKYNGNTILYYLDSEIDFSAHNIVKAINESQKYYIKIIKNSSAMNEYLKSFCKLFNVYQKGNIAYDSIQLTKAIKNYFYSLPSIARLISVNNNVLDIPEEFIVFKNCVMKENLNSYEFIFNDTPNMFNAKIGSEKIYNLIKMMKKTYDTYYDKCLTEYMLEFKNILNITTKTNLKSGFDNFLNENKEKISSNIFSNKTRDFITYLFSNNSYDDDEILNKLSNMFCGVRIADYKGSEFSKLKNEIIKCIEEITNSKDKNGNKEIVRITIGTDTIEKGIKKEISTIGNTLKNVLSDEIDEYGSSIDNEEKAYILIKLIEGLVK